MKRYYANDCLLVAVLGMALLVTGLAQGKTEHARQVTIIQDMAPVGLAYGQTLRISVVNPLPPAAPGEDGRQFKMLFAPLILDEQGRVIARRDEITLDPGEFHSFNFNRAEMPSPGEAGTGRLQVRGEIQRRFFPGIVSRFSAGSSNTVVELVDNRTGQTQAAALLRSEDTGSSRQCQAQAIGLADRQSLRVSVANTAADRGSQPLLARIRLDDAGANLIAGSGELLIPPGEFRSYDFPRSALPLTGEAGTGRVQMKATVFVAIDNNIDTSDATLELMDSSTGRTAGLYIPAVQKVRTIGIPNS